ncbi:MAG: proline dehydrogenase family protein, partial [Hymenobacter sp.]
WPPSRWPPPRRVFPFSVFKVTGLMPTVLLEKTQAGTTLSAAEQAAFERGQARLDALCASAHQHGVRLFVDAEESWFQQTIDDLAEDHDAPVQPGARHRLEHLPALPPRPPGSPANRPRRAPARPITWA